ncbi:HlyD family type I secretion periplasmic adaptor subunit [Glaesserella sp.]|uniref:HlyD family type I secretion periplasmic adaptor subunit n=1 Tax=Glaesserella sp. TaxID=2094731 RepID=UPI0035A01704
MSLWLEGLCELIKRYLTIFSETWKIRRQFDSPLRQEDENAFLPAHLELIESPISALPKWIGRLIFVFLLIAVVWAYLGKVDIVAVAPGKIMPSGRSKTIQPIETAMVKQVYVRNGQEVKKDQLLMELVAMGADADHSKSEEALNAAILSKYRQKALLNAMDNNVEPTFVQEVLNQSELVLPVEILQQEQALIRSQYTTWSAQKERLNASIKQREAEIKTTEIEVNKLRAMQKYEVERRNDFKSLYKTGGVSKHEYFVQENKLIELTNELHIQRSKLDELSASLNQAKQEYRYFIESFRRDVLEELRKANESISQLSLEVEKSKQRRQFTEIRSPVDGSVQQLQTYTIGGVVTTAQPLMVIVPKDDQLEIDAMISNKDIGFIQVGQDVVIKVEAFPYTRYGYITGKIKHISFDAINDEELGLVFSTTILMDKNYLNIDGKEIHLMAGMTVSAEIKTGKRSVMDYLLSPLKTTVDESMRER